jgi:hypothetical protein
MINLYNPNEYFKNIDISEIKQWAESSHGINFYEENNQFCIIATLPIGNLAIVLYTTLDRIPTKCMQELKSIRNKLIISDKYLDGFIKFKNPVNIFAMSEVWDLEFNFYAYT